MRPSINDRSIIHVVDDDPATCQFLGRLFLTARLTIIHHETAEDFLAAYDDHGDQPRCLVVDFRLPGADGLELQQSLNTAGAVIPVIMCTGYGEVSIAVRALEHGAIAFLEKPIDPVPTLKWVETALQADEQNRNMLRQRSDFMAKVRTLSRKEHEVLQLMIDARSIKEMATELNVGFQTAAKHHASVLRKLSCKNDAALVAYVISIGREQTMRAARESLSPTSRS